MAAPELATYGIDKHLKNKTSHLMFKNALQIIINNYK